MASPNRSSASQIEYGATTDSHQHQMRLVESSSEDDDDEDEHKLQIDLSSAEDDTSSLESHRQGHGHCSDVVPPPKGDSLLASESHSDPSNSDPLQSLQMLVHSPYAKAQILSATDMSSAKGCKSTFAANAATSSNLSISSSQLQPSQTASSSSSAQSSSAIRLTPVPVSSSPINAVPEFTPAPSAANFDPSSKTDDDSVAEEEEEGEEEDEEEEEEDDDSANRVSVATIERVLKKLNAAAIDEINLRTLQELPSEEAFSFNRFRKMLSNHPQFDALPNLSAMVGAGSAFPPRQNLSALMRQELPSPGDPFTFPMVRNPPALTVISKLDMPMVLSRPGRRRSPPPMVPIASFRGCASNNGGAGNGGIYDDLGGASAQPLAADGVFDRLRRLGTDVAIEPRSPPQFALDDEDNDEYGDYDDELPFVPPECILSTEPAVTKVGPLPSLMPIPSDHARSVSLSRVQPPPPSLIPINRAPSKWPTARFVPILPRDPPPAWNIHVNQTPVTSVTATTFSRAVGSNIFSTNQKFSFSSATSVIKKPKKPKLANKSHFTKLANSLVLPANAPKKLDPVLVAESMLAKAMKPKSSARLGELEIIKVGPASSNDKPKPALRPTTPPYLTFTATSSTFAQQPEIAPIVASTETVVLPPPQVVLPPPSTTRAAPVASSTKPNFFEFSQKKFANSIVLTKSQRKLYGCCVCSTVYHKMFSLKKHFFRTHVNPFCISHQDALKYDVTIPLNSGAIGNQPPSEIYRCDTCVALFGDHEQLRQHLGEHQPSNYEHANRYRCSGCNFVFRKEKVFTRHLLECASSAAAASAPPAAANVTQPVTAETPAESAAAAATIAAVSVVVAESEVPSNDKMGNDDEPVAAASSAAIVVVPQPQKSGAPEKTDEAIAATSNANMMCLFCEVTFKDNTERQKHVLQKHHPKRKQQTCAYCKKKDMNDLRELLQHICEVHNKKYFGCAKCKIRFKTKEELTAHRQESHTSSGNGTEKTALAVDKPKPAASVKTKNGRTFRCSKCLKLCKGMTELLSHRKTAHYQPKAKIKHHVYDGSNDFLVTRAKHAPFSTDDYETEFYRNISQNVKTNLECYLDGKLDQKAPTESKCVTRSSQYNNSFGISSSSNADGDIVATPNGELGFVEMYGRENFNAVFLRNASRLHIGTQLTMLKKTNVLRQNGGPEAQPIAGGVFVPSKLSLTPQKLNAVSVTEEGSKDVMANSTKEIEFSGEWIRSRRYICKVCLARYNGFWEIEDHFWAKHPNVWHSFYEFPAEQDPGAEFLQTCKRFLSNAGVCGKADTKWSTSTPSSECSKCGLVFTPIAEFHKHILECGGDTNWMATMYTPTKKHKKWRPYSGHRRRRTITKNRMFVRNIPETPMKIPSQSKGKQKAGDSDSIQKMIANLPPKRITRRVVNFDDINRSRFLTHTSVLTRRRREQLDPKASARIAKTFAVDNVDVMSIVRRKRKGSKSTFKVPSSIQNHQQPQKALPIASDPALQPIVQVEAIKIENNSEVISVSAMVHAACSSSTDYETLTVEEQLDIKVEFDEKADTKNADVPIVEETIENSLSKSAADILKEKLPAAEAPSIVATSVDAVSAEIPEDVSQIVPPFEVPVDEVAVGASPTNNCVTTVPVEVSVAQISFAKVPDSTPVKVSVEAPVDIAAAIAFVDKSLNETPITKSAIEEEPVEVLNTLEISDHIPSAAMPIENSLASASPIIDKEVDQMEDDASVDMGSSQPAGRQSPALPDSSVILAAMADTFRQTDTIAPNTIYGGGRKRKRGSKQHKCKKCGLKSSKKLQLCVACTAQQQPQQMEARLSPPPQKKRAVYNNFLQFVCESCGSEVFSTAREGKICDMCLEKAASAKVEKINELPTAPLLSVPLKHICGNCGCAFMSDSSDISICDICTSHKVCATCGNKFDVQNDATICVKCSLAATAAAAPPKAQAMVTAVSAMVRVTTPEKVTETKLTLCRLCGETCASSSSDLCVHCQPKTPKQSYLAESSVMLNSSTRSRYDIPETVATPKAKYETPLSAPPQLRTPSPRKLVDDNRCIHCNEQTSDRNDTGNPACRMCHELWITLNTDNLEPVLSADSMDLECIECDVLRTNEATSHRYCEDCTAKRNCSLAPSFAVPPGNDLIMQRRRSSEVSVQVGDTSGLADVCSRVTKMPMLTPTVPGISTTSTMKPLDDPNNKSATGTKNTLLLICKGCYGTYNTVSAYKEHRLQCPFRNSDDEASKKPLLGFAKRIKSGVEIVQVDSPGAGPFEIDGGGVLQMHDETIGATPCSLLPKLEPSDNISGQSTSSPDLDSSTALKRFKTKIATDESIEETINSVIERFCSTSTPIIKQEEDKINSEALADTVPDISDIADESSALAASLSLSTDVDKRATKRLRNKPVDSPTRARNMRAVEGQVEKLLQSSKSKKTAARKVFSFADSCGTADAACVSEESAMETSTTAVDEDCTKKRSLPSTDSLLSEVSSGDVASMEPVFSSPPFKKKLRRTKVKSGSKAQTQQKSKVTGSENSSAPASATASTVVVKEQSSLDYVNTANVSKESSKSGSKKVLKKFGVKDTVLGISSRLRRKAYDRAASRVLRSKSKGSVAEESRVDIPLAPLKQEENVARTKKTDMAVVAKNEHIPKESASSDRRRNLSADKAKMKLVESETAAAEPPVSPSASTEADTKPPKTKGTKRKSDTKDSPGAANSKRVRSSSQDLGFNVAKTGKNVRSNVHLKDEDGKETMDEPDQLSTSSTSAISTEEPLSGSTESTATTAPSNISERGNFLELAPSVPHSYLQVSSIGERPASTEGPKVRRTIAEEESMANHCRDQSNDLEQQQHQLRFIESLSDSNFKDAAEMQRIQQNLERSFSYVISMLNAVCEVLGSPEVSSANSLDPSVAEELEELKKYADVASEAVLMLKNAKMEDSCIDFSHDFSSVIFETKEPPKLYCELESQTKNSKDFVIHKSSNENKAQNNANKTIAPVVNGTKTATVKNGKIKSNKNPSNGVKRKLRCNHCQKVLPTKNEMAAHIQDHFRRFTTSKKDNAAMLKMCIADGFEQLLKDKAIDSFLKYSNVTESGLCAPLKILTQSRENQLEKWKSVVNQLVEIEIEGSSEFLNGMTGSADAFTCKIKQNVENVESSSNVGDSKPVLTTKRAKNGTLYQCPMCSTTYEQKQLRNRHLMMVHTRQRSSQKFIFDLDSAKSARANLNVDLVINANSSASKKDTAVPSNAVKCNGSLVTATTTRTTTTSSTTTSGPPSVTTTAAVSAKKVDRLTPPSSSPPTLPKLDPASLPPPLLPANVEMPATTRKTAAARQSPPALTIASPIANSRLKTPPSFSAVVAAPPATAPAKAATAPAKPNGSAANAGRNVNGATVATPATTAPAKTSAPQPTATGKRCRKKMSRKEMNIPAHVIKAKAEEALRELTGNRFYKFA